MSVIISITSQWGAHLSQTGVLSLIKRYLTSIPSAPFLLVLMINAVFYLAATLTHSHSYAGGVIPKRQTSRGAFLFCCCAPRAASVCHRFLFFFPYKPTS